MKSLNESRIGWHHCSTFFTGTQLNRPVKFAKAWQEIFFNVIQVEAILMQFVIAVVTKPDQSILVSLRGSFALNHQTHCIGRSLGAMWSVGGQQEHFPLFDWDI